MCWLCDHPGRTQEEYFTELRATIAQHGWAVQYIEDDRIPFAYTIGPTRRKLPELLVTGAPNRQSGDC